MIVVNAELSAGTHTYNDDVCITACQCNNISIFSKGSIIVDNTINANSKGHAGGGGGGGGGGPGGFGGGSGGGGGGNGGGGGGNATTTNPGNGGGGGAGCSNGYASGGQYGYNCPSAGGSALNHLRCARQNPNDWVKCGSGGSGGSGGGGGIHYGGGGGGGGGGTRGGGRVILVADKDVCICPGRTISTRRHGGNNSGGTNGTAYLHCWGGNGGTGGGPNNCNAGSGGAGHSDHLNPDRRGQNGSKGSRGSGGGIFIQSKYGGVYNHGCMCSDRNGIVMVSYASTYENIGGVNATAHVSDKDEDAAAQLAPNAIISWM